MSRRGISAGDHILGSASDSHADWCAAYGRWGKYRFVGASAIGKLHLHHSRPRDDAFAVRTAGAWLAVAVADGVGSRELSRYGSSYAVNALCEYLLWEASGIPASIGAENAKTVEKKPAEDEIEIRLGATSCLLFWLKWFRRRRDESWAPAAPSPMAPSDLVSADCGTLAWYSPQSVSHSEEGSNTNVSPLPDLSECVRRAFQGTRLGLEKFAGERRFGLKDLHCTLLGMLLNTETGAVAAGHIGDGLVALLHPGLGAQPLVEAPTPGDAGETYVVTQDDWEQYLVVRSLSEEEVQGITTFYLMTDGVADDYTPPDVFERWAKDIDREMRKEEPLSQTATRLLHWLANYEVKGSWDDRTLVVVLRD